jgi:hypothetical protein
VAFAIRASAAGCSSAGQLALSSVEDWGANLERRSPLSFTEPKIITRLAPARYRVSVTGLGDPCYVPDGTLLDLGAPRDGSPVTITAVPAGAIDGVVSGPKLAAGRRGGVSRPFRPQSTGADRDARFRIQVHVRLASTRPISCCSETPERSFFRWTDESAPGVTVEVVGGETVKVIIPEVPLP